MKSPLKNGLFVKRSIPNRVLLFVDFFLKIFAAKPVQLPSEPKKILLCNIANIGDVVISTSVLPILSSRFPNAEIGFLGGSQVVPLVLGKHPLISHIHPFDHWVFELRKEASFFRKCKAALHHWTQKRSLIREIKRVKYDVAIDLYSYFPNAIPLLKAAKIPIRIGYTTGGFGSLLTHPLKWDFQKQYIGYAHHHLLTPLGIEAKGQNPLPYYPFCRKRREHIVLHVGSSTPVKDWPISEWVELIQRLKKSFSNLVLTGSGKREALLCSQISQKSEVVNLCDTLSWTDFVTTIQEAQLLISVDSAAVHVAAAALVPTLVIMTGINDPAMWTPPHPFCQSVATQVECSPCYRKQGCREMRCIRNTSAERVFDEALALLKRKNG